MGLGISGRRAAARLTKPWVLIAVCFTASRLYARACGLRFEGREWEKFWHFVDPNHLDSALLESVYYLHGQPPLPNLVMGTALKIFGDGLPTVFSLIFLACGAALTAGVFALMRRMAVGPWLAAILTSLWCASPGVLLFENFLFYTYPVLVLLLLAALVLHLAIERQSRRLFWLFFGVLGLIVLSRTLFHPVWLIAVIALALRYSRERRRLVVVALIPLAIVASVMLKNQVEFGRFSLSSWRGMNIGRAVLDRTPENLRKRWVAEGKLSPWALVGPFKPLDNYPGLVLPTPTGIRVLDDARKSNKKMNLHHLAYLEVAETLEKDARYVIRKRPGLYLRAIGMSLLDTMRPASSYRALEKPRAHLRSLERIYDVPMSWTIGRRDVGPWPLALPLLVLFGMLSVRRSQRPAERATWIFMVGTILWVVLVGALAEREENARFRFLVDPFLLILGARMAMNSWALTQRWLRSRQR